MPTSKKKKTSVAEIVALHAAYQGRSIGQRLREILNGRRMRALDFVHLLGRNNDPTVYAVLKKDSVGIGIKLAKMWEAALRVPEGTFPARGREIPRGWRSQEAVVAAPVKLNGHAPPMLAVSRPMPPPLRPIPPPPPKEAGPDQFAFVIDATGRATLRLNLEDVPLEAALRTVTTLATSGVLRIADRQPGGENTPLKEIGDATRNQEDPGQRRREPIGPAALPAGGAGVDRGGEQAVGPGEEG